METALKICSIAMTGMLDLVLTPDPVIKPRTERRRRRVKFEVKSTGALVELSRKRRRVRRSSVRSVTRTPSLETIHEEDEMKQKPVVTHSEGGRHRRVLPRSRA